MPIPHREFMSDHQQESMLRSLENAHRLLRFEGTRGLRHFPASRRTVRDAYNTGRFGHGCLLARRLVEAGARFVEVTTEYVPFVHWDTHENGHETAARLKKEIDRPIATAHPRPGSNAACSTARWSSSPASSAAT